MGLFQEIDEWFKDLGKKEVEKDDENKMIDELAHMNAVERNRLEQLAKEYAESFRPPNKEFEYLEDYVPVSKDKLKEQSTNKYSDDYNKNLEKTNKDFEDKLSAVENKEDGYKQSAEQKSDYYNDKYKDLEENYKSKASKNGIADSSIKSEKTVALKDERDGFIEDVMLALKNKLELTAGDKKELLENKNQKVTALNQKFQKDVEDYLNKLIAEEDKKVENVKKTNEETAKKEQDYKEYQAKVVTDKYTEAKNKQKEMIEEELNGHFEDETREKDYDERYKIAKEFYSKYKKSSAADAIRKNDRLKAFLGNKYYRLLGEFDG